jgi:hypothetical protein
MSEVDAHHTGLQLNDWNTEFVWFGKLSRLKKAASTIIKLIIGAAVIKLTVIWYDISVLLDCENIELACLQDDVNLLLSVRQLGMTVPCCCWAGTDSTAIVHAFMLSRLDF